MFDFALKNMLTNLFWLIIKACIPDIQKQNVIFNVSHARRIKSPIEHRVIIDRRI